MGRLLLHGENVLSEGWLRAKRPQDIAIGALN